ncbi:MAG: DUF4390 domain-containing protein [Burkholderiales bacterium]
MTRWLLRGLLWLAVGSACIAQVADAAQSNGIDVRKAALTASDEGYLLEAEFDIQLTPLLDDVLHKGVPLYFTLEFEVMRPRWYWANEKILVLQHQQRLSFNTLTRQYRVGAGALYQNFPSLTEAIGFMSRVRRREDIEANALRKDTSYAAALRMRLDATQLPKPFQLNTGRDWYIGSDWFRWTVTP